MSRILGLESQLGVTIMVSKIDYLLFSTENLAKVRRIPKASVTALYYTKC